MRSTRAGFLPERDPAELAASLARKAQADATATRKFAADLEIADDIIGFHAQQAVEKWLKAVMAIRQMRQTRIHDINRLGESLEEDGVATSMLHSGWRLP
jgi:hypothetical protein